LQDTVILGAGVTGLAAAWVSGAPIYEAQPLPGGICRSYYQAAGASQPLAESPPDGSAYRFENGGGHWIFGGDPLVLEFLAGTGDMPEYRRKAAVFFSQQRLTVPFPLQYHLGHLDPAIAARALEEMKRAGSARPRTMAEWVEASFGKTLTDLFFGPFHERYTAGLWTRIAPQDAYKSPVDLAQVERGMAHQAQPAGYNTTFRYPKAGLQAVVSRMASDRQIEFNRRVAQIDLARREIAFTTGAGCRYERALCTLPLNRALAMAGIESHTEPWPSTSVLVLNIGATRGPAHPDAHWLYVPDSRSGFFRVGCYSNVDSSFLPAGAENRTALYIERAFPDGVHPDDQDVQTYAQQVIDELREWKFIGEVDVVSPTWIEVAYTWALPDSNWRAAAVSRLAEAGIHMVGRYGRWKFQGIAESVMEGFGAGASMRDRGAGH
jgi:protoporphyrinogen oxidase